LLPQDHQRHGGARRGVVGAHFLLRELSFSGGHDVGVVRSLVNALTREPTPGCHGADLWPEKTLVVEMGPG
jgi:hypothetical protein